MLGNFGLSRNKTERNHFIRVKTQIKSPHAEKMTIFLAGGKNEPPSQRKKDA